MKPKGQEDDRRFWGAVIVIYFLLWACLWAFHRFARVGRGLSVDGLAEVETTLFAAATGFLAVLFQVRSASRQLREQLADQHQASDAESERQKKAVAAALLSEIDCFYAAQLSDRSKLFESSERTESGPEPTEVFYSLVGKPFVVYESLADKLGGFDSTIARGIVLTYGSMATFVELLKLYERDVSDTSSRAPLGQEARKTLREQMQKRVRQSAERAVQLAALICEKLCGLSGTDFSTLFIAKESEGRHQH